MSLLQLIIIIIITIEWMIILTKYGYGCSPAFHCLAVRAPREEVLLPEMAPAKWTIAAPAEHQRFHDLARARCNITLCEREIQKYIPVFSTILFCISLFYLFGKCNLPFFYNSNSRKNYSILKTILLFKFIISWIPSREVSRKLTAKTNCP